MAHLPIPRKEHLCFYSPDRCFPMKIISSPEFELFKKKLDILISLYFLKKVFYVNLESFFPLFNLLFYPLLTE